MNKFIQLTIKTALGIFLLLVILIIIAIVTFLVLNQRANNRIAEWDAWVVEKCNSEGGVTVFETVSAEDFPALRFRDSLGLRRLDIPREQNKNADEPFYTRSVTSVIRETRPRVTKSEAQLIRAFDNNILGISVSFSRIGGPILGHSSFSCLRIPGFDSGLVSKIIL